MRPVINLGGHNVHSRHRLIWRGGRENLHMQGALLLALSTGQVSQYQVLIFSPRLSTKTWVLLRGGHWRCSRL